MKRRRYYLDIPDGEIPDFETFYNAFLLFADAVYTQGDQLSELIDNLEHTISNHIEKEKGED